jgi:UDP-hydrolysing UDP-N-acetyl-D-glucosamine 2-epimerase
VRRRKVCVVVTARPSYSRIKTALKAIASHPDLELQLVLAASALLDRYGDVSRVIEADGFEIAARVFIVLEGETPTAMAKSTGLGLLELATVFDNLKPDIVVTVADRYETLATTIAAAYMNIPVAHVQGGEVTGSIDEKVRHAVTKLSDIHLVSSKPAAERVIRMGEEPKAVHTTGCPSIDLALEMLRQPEVDFEPVDRYRGLGLPMDPSEDYVVVMQHPVTTEHDVARQQITETLHAVHKQGLPALWFWPNVDAGSDGTSRGIRVFREQERPDDIRFFKNMSPTDFLKVLYNARCLVGNSSVGIRESSFLGVPVVNIGTRQMGRDRGRNVMDVDYCRDQIGCAISRQLSRGKRYPSDTLYGTGQAGLHIAECLVSSPLTSSKRLTY